MYMVCDSVQYCIRLGQSLKTEKFHIKSDFLASLETTRRSGSTRPAFWRGSAPRPALLHVAPAVGAYVLAPGLRLLRWGFGP